MKTKLTDIVSFDLIGSSEVTRGHDILTAALNEELRPAAEDEERILLLGIDMQNDFMENGSLGVPGAHDDLKNALHFIYKHMSKITDIVLSIDTHIPQQIFHSAWWVDKDGNHPEPYTVITSENIRSGKWRALQYKEESLSYVEALEKLGKKQLLIWPYHCILGTFGHALESQFAQLVYFHSIARQSPVVSRLKGSNPLTEMYGLFKPEVSTEAETDFELLSQLKSYDKILILGQAKSHCVLESVGQMLDFFYGDRQQTEKIYVLEDCMSSISGFEEATEATFKEWEKTSGIHLVQSTELKFS